MGAEIDVAGGTAELGPGNPGRGLRSRISTGDGRARLFRSIAPGTVHVDFDLQTKKPAFASDDSWLDLLLILPRRTASGSGIGLEWTPAGLHLFTPGSPGFFVPYPSTCAWVHVHMSVRLTDVAVGEVSLSFNGEQVLEEAGIATQGEAPESPVIAIGGQARNVSSTADILYDNISISSAP